MVKKIVLSVAAVLFACASVFAQNLQVSGSVTGPDGKPVVGATVIVDGTTIGTSTDVSGRYTLSAPANGTLAVSFIGYTEAKVAINGKTMVNVSLKEDSENIDEVVVVGYGSGRKIGTIIGSVDQVKADKLEDRPSANVMDAMQGQVPGLQIFTSSGELDQTSTIRLHGLSSLSASSEPLILLDGAPITTGTLMSMNSNDIEAMTVLKDASATSIYGSRAANGVIYVTSKKGSRGQDNAVVTLRAQYSLNNPLKLRMERMSTDQLLDYNAATYASWVGDDYSNPRVVAAWRDILAQQLFHLEDQSVNVDWFKEIMRENAPMYQVDLSVSGGTPKTTYFISGNYTDQVGIAPGSELTRYTFRANVDSQVKKWLKVGMNIGVGYQKSSNASTNSTSGGLYTDNPVFASFLIPSYQPAQDENGNDLDFLQYYGTENPKYSDKWYKLLGNRIQLNGSAFIQLNPVKGLTLRSQLSANAFDYRSTTSYSPSWPTETGVQGVGSIGEGFQRNYDWTWTNTAEYKHTFAQKHNMTVLVGHESIYGNTQSFAVATKGQAFDELLNLGAGTENSGLPSYSTGEYAYNSVFARAEYDFAERYFVDASVRYDACSRFGSAYKGAIFWSVGAMWNIKNEAFMSGVKQITALALKASYGTQGNSGIGNYSQYQMIAPSSYPYDREYAMGFASMGNPFLAWEKQSTLTIGANIELWRKLSLSIDWYRRETSDMLMPRPLAPSAGFSSYTDNIGAMRNSGVDIGLNYTIFANKDWFVNFYFNFNYNRNQITKLWEEGLTKSSLGDGTMQYYIIGRPFGSFYCQEWRGIDPQTGETLWTAADGGTTSNFDEAIEVDLKKSTQAPFSGGFGIAVSWKGIGLNADFAWVQGNYMVNNNLYFFANPDFLGYGQVTEALDYWKRPGDVCTYPRLDVPIQFDSHLVEDASFLRLKNLQLSYTLPKHLLKNQNILSGFKVYVSARNLFTATKYKGLDPEVANGLGAFDADNYPNTRQWTFGCEFKF